MKVWEATVDNKYFCDVVRTNDYDGVLTIRVPNAAGAKCIAYQTGVKLTAGAIFGADIADVNEWEALCIDYVDKVKQ